MNPTIGRIVHYVDQRGLNVIWPAIVVQISPFEPTEVTICVFSVDGLMWREQVSYDAGKAYGTWHWPERV